MTFETDQDPPPQEPAPEKAERIDSDLRVAIARVTRGDLTIRRRPQGPEEIPRAAKISFTIAIAIIIVVILIPIVSFLMRVEPEAPKPVAHPAPAPVADAGGTRTTAEAAAPRSAPNSSTGNYAPISAGAPPENVPHIQPPMPPSALTVLSGLWGLLYEASRPAQGVQPGTIDPERYFPKDSLDGSPAEVLKNLTQAQLRVYGQPVLALRVTRELQSSFAYSFEIEVLSETATGEELVARGRIDMAPVDEQTMRVLKLDPLEPFDSTGLKVTAATFEQGVAPRELTPAPPPIPGKPPAAGQTLAPAAVVNLPVETEQVATYPYIIH